MVARTRSLRPVSIGITLSSEGIESTDSLIRDADTAMYRAKASGKGRYEMFDPACTPRAVRAAAAENPTAAALEGRVPHPYQPIVSLIVGEISGC